MAVPAVIVFPEVDADDAFGLELAGLVLHPLHRELTRVVERLRKFSISMFWLAVLKNCRRVWCAT